MVAPKPNLAGGADMTDTSQTNSRTFCDKPFWVPDTQGFLAIAIIAVIAALAFILVGSSIKFDDKVAGAFMTLLGVLTACLKDVYSFFFGSSSGSAKKDETQGRIVEKLTSSAPPTGPVAPLPPPVVIVAWWSLLTDPERETITAASINDAGAAAFMAAAKVGKASDADLANLVALGLLTQARADAIKAS